MKVKISKVYEISDDDADFLFSCVPEGPDNDEISKCEEDRLAYFVDEALLRLVDDDYAFGEEWYETTNLGKKVLRAYRKAVR
jgi:hypothetical protein